MCCACGWRSRPLPAVQRAGRGARPGSGLRSPRAHKPQCCQEQEPCVHMFYPGPCLEPPGRGAGLWHCQHHITLKTKTRQTGSCCLRLCLSRGSSAPGTSRCGAGGARQSSWPIVSPLTLEMRVPAAVRVSRVLSSGYLLMTWRRTRRVSPRHSWASGRCGSVGSAREGAEPLPLSLPCVLVPCPFPEHRWAWGSPTFEAFFPQ